MTDYPHPPADRAPTALDQILRNLRRLLVGPEQEHKKREGWREPCVKFVCRDGLSDER